MAISTRDRLETLKRDGFTCTYCGRRPPEVVLHVDHIVPKAEGGPDELENYVTSCGPCNLGKGARPLLTVTPCVFCGRDRAGFFFKLPPKEAERRMAESDWSLVCSECLEQAARAFAYLLWINSVTCAGCGRLAPRDEVGSEFKAEDFVTGGLAWICDTCKAAFL